jgi:hypothetical protein
MRQQDSHTKIKDRLMTGDILPILKFCSIFLVISFINGGRYFFFRRKLILIYEEHKEEINRALSCCNIKFSAFLEEPLETGNDTLDLLLFKIHRSAKWFLGLLLFYATGVAFFYLISMLQKIQS